MTYLLTGLVGIGVGYALALVATWVRVHEQESNIRMLALEIEALREIGDEVPAEWVQYRLNEMVSKDYR